MEELIGIGASALGGSGLGIIGSLLGRGLGIFEKIQNRKTLVLTHAHELSLLQEQRQAKQEETEQEIRIADTTGSWKGLSESHRADAAITGTSRWVANCRAMVRVILTPSLIVMVGGVLWMLTHGDLDTYLTSGEVFYLVSYTVKSIVFMASTSVAWWFGDRAPRPKGL